MDPAEARSGGVDGGPSAGKYRGGWARRHVALASQPANVPIRARRMMGILSKLGCHSRQLCLPTTPIRGISSPTTAKRKTGTVPAPVTIGVIVIFGTRHEKDRQFSHMPTAHRGFELNAAPPVIRNCGVATRDSARAVYKFAESRIIGVRLRLKRT